MPNGEKPRLEAIVLAAGSGRRYGGDKRLAPVDGASLLQNALSKPLALGLATTVVLKPDDEPLLSALLGHYKEHQLLKIVYAKDASSGMGHSLAAGVTAILQSPENVDGAFIFLADMPFLEIVTIQTIASRFDFEKIVVPCNVSSEGKRLPGHPVLFGRPWLERLCSLSGDNGAKSILRDNQQDIIYIPVSDKGILLDIDQPDDLPADSIEKTGVATPTLFNT